MIAKIGEAALVVVDPNGREGARRQKDRRSSPDLQVRYGSRSATRLRHPLVEARHAGHAAEVMRHASIETTMKFYVEHNADDISADLWRWQGSVFG
jgi:hypothetical protein